MTKTKDLAPVTPLQTTQSPLIGLANKFNIEPTKLLDVLRGTVIKPDRQGKAATNEEVAAFCIVAQQYGLNPFTREIHAFASGDKGIVPIVGIDGWTHIVNSSGKFDGCEFENEADDDGSPISITCRMHVKDRSHPICATERFAECKRNTAPWNTMPWRMLRHKAYMQAARLAFGLSGIYDEDEARDIMSNSTGVVHRDPLPMPKAISERSNIVEANGDGKHQAPADDQDAFTGVETIFNDLCQWLNEAGDLDTLNTLIANSQKDFAAIRNASADAFEKLNGIIAAKRAELAPEPAKPSGKKGKPEEMFENNAGQAR